MTPPTPTSLCFGSFPPLRLIGDVNDRQHEGQPAMGAEVSAAALGSSNCDAGSDTGWDIVHETVLSGDEL